MPRSRLAFCVALLAPLLTLLASPAQAAEAGATTVNVGISYRPSLPLTSCVATTFQMDTGLTQNLSLIAGSHTFAGLFEAGATGASSCESAHAGSGTITIDGTGFDVTSKNVLRCPGFTGTYTRVEAGFVATAAGSCTFPDGAIVPMTVALTGVWRVNEVGFDGSVVAAALYGSLGFAAG